MARLTLVVGGTRSGKSRHAEGLARQAPPVSYLATAQAGDEEMARRIAIHQARRAAWGWQTVEEPWDLPAAVSRHAKGTLLIDCLTLWLSNLLVGIPGHEGLDDARARAAIEALLDAIKTASGRVVLVSNETGCGIVPAIPLARRFADLQGEANQWLASMAAEV